MEPMQTPKLETTPPRKQKSTLLGILAIVLAIGVIAIVGWLTWSAWNDRNDEETPAAAVNITTEGFVPSTIQIKKGSDVTWTNRDSNARSLQGDDEGLGLETKSLTQGNAYSFMFEDSGTFTYHDPLNPAVKGTVVVE